MRVTVNGNESVRRASTMIICLLEERGQVRKITTVAPVEVLLVEVTDMIIIMHIDDYSRTRKMIALVWRFSRCMVQSYLKSSVVFQGFIYGSGVVYSSYHILAFIF